jgi:leader peptidase (prepilin peptidase) / N-methyltransferase
MYMVVLLVLAAAFGASWGSFLNVCIARIPRGMSVVSPPSHCFACGAHVRARDNIPILSYFLLRGRCRHCGARFSARHALVEALMGTLSVLILWFLVLEAPGLPLGVRVARYTVYFTFAAVLVALTFIDIDTKRLPDIITLPFTVVFFLGGFATGEIGWLERAIGAAVGYGFVRMIADIYYYSTGREGLGLGDGKLLAMMGALLGWKALPAIVCSSAFVGIMVSVPVLLVQRHRQKQTGAGATPPAPAASPSQEPTATDQASQEPAASDQPAAPAAPISIRRTEVPFGPFLSACALVYIFQQQRVWGFIDTVGNMIARAILGG